MSLEQAIQFIDKNNTHKVKILSKMQRLIKNPIKPKVDLLVMKVNLKPLVINQK